MTYVELMNKNILSAIQDLNVIKDDELIGDIYCDWIDNAIQQLEKRYEYRWHDLTEDPDDLPEVDKRVYLAVQMEGYISYITGSYTISYSDLKTLEFESDDYYRVNNCIAWKEIEPFDSKIAW